MSPSAIVIHLHVFKDLSFCFIPGLEPIPVYEFNLERVEKALRDGVIPAVAFFAHATDELVLGQYRLKIISSVLTAAVSVADKSLQRVAS